MNRKTSDKATDSKKPDASSWRDQLTSLPSTLDDDDDDDEEQFTIARPKRSNLFESLNSPADKATDSKKPTSSSWRDQLTSLPSSLDDDDEDTDDDFEETGSILKGLGPPQPQKPRSTILGSGPRPVPKPTSKSQNVPPSLDEVDDLEYELIDDDLLYDDDDEFGFFDDDDGFYDDDL